MTISLYDLSVGTYLQTLGAINGIKEGIFTPHPSTPDFGYAGLKALVEDASIELQGCLWERWTF